MLAFGSFLIKPVVLSLSLLVCTTARKPHHPLGWRLHFEDDFDGDYLDQSKWEHQTGCGDQYGQDQFQCYTPNNLAIEHGLLKLTAKIEPMGNKMFTSGRIRQLGNLPLTYGKVVVRAKSPSGRLLFPAIWLKSRHGCYQEIDLLEIKGQNPYVLYFTAFYGSNRAKAGTHRTTNTDHSEGFHDYEITWNRDGITWYVDDRQVYSVSTASSHWQKCAGEPVVFGQPMDLILNLAVGGSRMFPGDNYITLEVASQWRQPTFSVDWVRIYTLS